MNELEKNYILLSTLLKYHNYQALEIELNQLPEWQDEELIQTIQIARAILQTDLQQTKILTQNTAYQSLASGSILERKAYYYLQNMTLQVAREAYGDYLRGLTPLLVDLLRIVIEHDFFPELSDYITPITKETVDGISLYRGLQWSKDKIESSENLIYLTWKKYYGDYFNYDHYVSSSHLIKLIETHGKQPKLMELTAKLRQIEKYLRNIVAHEVLKVDRAFFQERIGMTPEEVHNILIEVYQEAGLKNEKQLNSIMHLREMIQNQLTSHYERKIKEQSK